MYKLPNHLTYPHMYLSSNRYTSYLQISFISPPGGDDHHSLSRTEDSPTNDLTATSHFKISPGVSPVFFDRQLLPEIPGQEKVVVRLPSMWQDSQTGYEWDNKHYYI